ncbi:MAG TPA: chemotaxis protein CheW [Acidobacteria bacterium]|nr:chemotaxis protein CheW [Acidobacteriota bacterium]
MNESQRYCTFEVEDLFLGVEVSTVQEVIRHQQMTRIPLAPRAVEGLINLRGKIVTAVDLRTRMQLGPRPEGSLPMNVVVHNGEGTVSLLVDRIGDVIEVEPATVDAPPPTLQGRARELIRGVYKLDDRLLLILDVGKAAAVGCADAVAS